MKYLIENNALFFAILYNSKGLALLAITYLLHIKIMHIIAQVI